MSSSFTDGTTAVVPIVTVGYDAFRPSQHQFHPILSGGEDVYARPAGLRKGTFTVVFDSLADAKTLFDMCAGTAPITYADSDLPSMGMVFLADGDVRLTLDLDTQLLWLATIDFHEVTP